MIPRLPKCVGHALTFLAALMSPWHASSGAPVPVCTIRSAKPVTVSHDGQVIEYARIRAENRPAITVNGFRNVTIRNVWIEHRNAAGIVFSKAPNLTIENVRIVNVSRHRNGRADRPQQNNIAGEKSPDLTIKRVTLIGGSAGVYLLRSPRARLRFIEGHNMRGPFPRGQLVQFDKSNDCLLEDFSVVNRPGKSWVEDNVSVYRSSKCIIRRGLVDGNDAPSGVGIMVEQSAAREAPALVEHVDAIRQGNGCFSAYPGYDVTFRHTRCRENICRDQGRGKPLSNALGWAGHPESRGLVILQSTYYALCNPDNIVWHHKAFRRVELKRRDFTPRPPIKNRFCWQSNTNR